VTVLRRNILVSSHISVWCHPSQFRNLSRVLNGQNGWRIMIISQSGLD